MRDKLLRQLASLKKTLNESSLDSAFEQIKAAIVELPQQQKQQESAEFTIPEAISGKAHSYVLYADGACRGNPGPGAFGCLVQDSQAQILFEHAQTKVPTTNNQMELMGVISALELLEDYVTRKSQSLADATLIVVTDSRYVVDGMTKWVSAWKKRGWKKADNKTPENLELWRQLDSLSLKVGNLTYQWVKGHAGHPQNEYCDQLANKALDHEGY